MSFNRSTAGKNQPKANLQLRNVDKWQMTCEPGKKIQQLSNAAYGVVQAKNELTQISFWSSVVMRQAGVQIALFALNLPCR